MHEIPSFCHIHKAAQQIWGVGRGKTGCVLVFFTTRRQDFQLSRSEGTTTTRLDFFLDGVLSSARLCLETQKFCWSLGNPQWKAVVAVLAVTSYGTSFRSPELQKVGFLSLSSLLSTPQPSAPCSNRDQAQKANSGLNKLRVLLLQPKIISVCPFFFPFTK